MKQRRVKSVGRPKKNQEPQDEILEDDLMKDEVRAQDEDPFSKIKPGA